MKRIRKIRSYIGLTLLSAVPAMAPGAAFAGPGDPPIWTTGFIAYAAVILLVPALLFLKRSRRARAIILLGSLAYFGFLQAACPSPTGAIEMALIHIGDRAPILMYLLKIGIVVIPALLFGRYFCGWICPKGAIQEYLYRPRLALRIPGKVDRALKYGKYVMLVLLILAPLVRHYRLYRAIGPFKVIFNLGGSTGLVIFLGAVLVASVFISRPFCRYLCPLGALLGIISRISPFRMRVLQSCSSCGLCARSCPVGAISRTPDGMRIDHMECIGCKECEEGCGRGGCTFGWNDHTSHKGQTERRSKMKKVGSVVAAGFILALALAGRAPACEITFESPSMVADSLGAGVIVDTSGVAEVTAIVKWEHRRCVLDEDDINVDYKGVVEVSSTGWKKVKRGVYQNTLRVRLTGQEDGTIRVWRSCSRKGISEGTIRILWRGPAAAGPGSDAGGKLPPEGEAASTEAKNSPAPK